MSPADIEPGWSGLLAGGLGVFTGWLLNLRRRVSRDAVELAKDRVELAKVESDPEEVKRLRLESNEYSRAVARLTAENEYISRELLKALHVAEKYARGLPQEVRAVIETDFADLRDLPKPPAGRKRS